MADQLSDARRPERRPAHPRVRRSLPALVMILVLGVAAGTVWWKVFHREEAAAASGACAGALDPHAVKVRVYNNSDREGLARSVAAQLGRRGFAILATANDPLRDQRPVTTGWAEVRYGTAGTRQARLVAAHVPGTRLVRDNRKDSAVDLAVGQRFKRLSNAAELARAMAAIKAADAKKADAGQKATQGILAAPSRPPATPAGC